MKSPLSGRVKAVKSGESKKKEPNAKIRKALKRRKPLNADVQAIFASHAAGKFKPDVRLKGADLFFPSGRLTRAGMFSGAPRLREMLEKDFPIPPVP